jgi:SAM-dependent methyltransferase
VRTALLEQLRCPRCQVERSFDVTVGEEDEREIRTGELRCRACEHVAPIEDGIVNLLFEPPEFVTREAAGLGRFVDQMVADGWNRERILKLPYEQSGYWFSQAAAMEHLMEINPPRPGATLLDIGSNTCWASNIFAKRGLRVTALDISTPHMQGLKTADWWMEENDIYFERILSVMFDPALATGSYDYVFCCEVLHHNHRENLQRTLRELYRILKPDGKLIVLNEPLRFPTNRKEDHAQEVAEFEGHEHVYYMHEYLLAAYRAGFKPRIVRPNTTPFFRGEEVVLRQQEPLKHAARKIVKYAIRRVAPARQAYTAYKLAVGPDDLSLGLLCTKRASGG